MNSYYEDNINSEDRYIPSLPFSFQNSFNQTFSIFGFTLYFEDILIIALAFFLFMQEDCDMLLVAVLVLIFLS